VATPRIGAVSIPAVGDMVLVQFIGGDLNAPIVTGSLYNDQDRPPPSDDGQSILHLPLAASDDDAVHVELHSGDRRALLFTLGGGLSLTAQDDDPVLELTVDGGKARVKIDRDGAIAIESNGAIELKGNEITIEAQRNLTLKGAKVNIN
jgi:uncharacterized protein involved in type VI secretion and phage assembly